MAIKRTNTTCLSKKLTKLTVFICTFPHRDSNVTISYNNCQEDYRRDSNVTISYNNCNVWWNHDDIVRYQMFVTYCFESNWSVTPQTECDTNREFIWYNELRFQIRNKHLLAVMVENWYYMSALEFQELFYLLNLYFP